MDIKELTASGFKFKKNLGQNFLTDRNLLKAIVCDAGVTSDDTVVEIGTGAATLTSVLCETAKKVVTFELDEDLLPCIKNTLSKYDNVTFLFKDVLKLSDEELRVWVPEPFKVVANLPYYVTTPMIMRFVESDLKITSLTLMMQKEVADRLVAKSGTKDYGSITVSLEAVADVTVTRTIDRRLFYPSPNVDSALVRIDFNKEKYSFKNFALFKKTVKAGFLMRRKTLVNNLTAYFSLPKSTAEKIVTDLGFSPTVRGETLACSDYIRLSDALSAIL